MPDTSNPIPAAVAAPAVLREVVARATRRLRARLALRSGSTGLLAGAGVSALLVCLLRGNLLSLDDWPGGEGFLALPILGGAVLGGLAGLARRVDPLGVARVLEQRLDLKERLSTALALSGDAGPHLARQRADAEAHAAAVGDLRRVLPLTPLPRHGYIALGLTVSVFLGWLLPTLPAFQSPAQKAQKKEVLQEGERLLRIAKALEGQAAAKKLPQVQRAAGQIRALGEEMKRGKMDKREALMKLSRLTQELKERQRAAAQGETAPSTAAGEKSLPSAGRDLEKALQEQEERQNGGKPSVKNAADAKTEAAMREAAESMKQNDASTLAEKLSRLADRAAQGDPKTAEGRERMARQLEAMGKSLKDTKVSPASEPLKDAAEALRRGDNQRAAEQMREAARRATEGERAAEIDEAMRQAAESLQNRQQQSGQEGSQGEGEPQQGQEGQQGQPQGSEGGTPQDSGEGQGKNDAFDAQGNAKQPGQDNKGKGSAQGGQQGKGEGEGKGSKRTMSGTGNGVGEGAGTPGGKKGAPKEAGPYQDPKGAKTGTYDGDWRVKKVKDENASRLYVPKNETRVSGKRGDKGKESATFFRGAPDKRDAATPYYEVYEKYAPAAESALSREDIPASYKKQVKDYFDSLRPEGKKP